MNQGYIQVFNQQKSLEEFALSLKTILNVADTNLKNSQKGQRRYGLNIGGGEYFLFEVFGLEIYVIQNAGEVKYFDNSCTFYLWIAPIIENLDELICKNLLHYLVVLLKANDISSEIEIE